MAAKALPPQDVLRQLLTYDPATGELRWKERGHEWFNVTQRRTADHTRKVWNARYAGQPAISTLDGCGYRSGPLLGVSVKSHRIIWKLVTGCDPDHIDHINGDRTDNRLANLRNVSPAENVRNHKRRSDNTTGHVGVYRYAHERRHSMWVVKVGSHHVGYFHCIGQAIRARKEAERRLGFHPNHGRAA